MAADLSKLPHDSGVFVDANIFVYGLTKQSAQCRRFLERCGSEDLTAYTTIEVVCEATHKLMLIEACAVGIIKGERASELRKRLTEIPRLRTYWVQTESIFGMNIAILASEVAGLRTAHKVRSTNGLLTNDSLIVAAMRDLELVALASADNDFDHVSGLTRYAPTDLPKVT